MIGQRGKAQFGATTDTNPPDDALVASLGLDRRNDDDVVVVSVVSSTKLVVVVVIVDVLSVDVVVAEVSSVN